MRRREEMTFLERIYVVEVLRGLSITTYRLVHNFVLHVLHLFGVSRNVAASASIQYPEERRLYAARYRGRHRLTLYEDGALRCTSCFLCATACPSRCIYIEAAEHDDPQVEKFPLRYEIDTLLCIYCGYCVEACPVDAIRMDTGLHPEVYPADPRNFIEDKETLMARSRLIEEKGVDGYVTDHMKKMQTFEREPFSSVE